VAFRVGALSGARENARAYGYQGARYPWESDPQGRECCPAWQYADHQVHVTADVAYALLHYAASVDPDYVRDRGAPVILETARYWMDRMDWRLGEDHPSLLGVMPPDEYSPISHNSAYLNRMVSLVLDRAAELTGDPSEAEAFREAAGGLPIPRSADGKLVLQSEDFLTLAEPHFERYWKTRGRVYAAQVSQEHLYRSKNLKQADVILLMQLFPHEFSDEEVRTAWDYYLPYTTHDSSLSMGIHAIVACRLGLDDQAWDFWLRSSRLDLDPTHGGAAEGIHIACCGNVWQMAVLGFAGMRTALQSEVPAFRPRLPAGWQRLAFRVQWKGAPLDVDITPEGCRVRNLGSEPLEVEVDGRREVLAPEPVLAASGDPG
jgi:kojibiose phosphorylase